jgi:hypothetical protein
MRRKIFGIALIMCGIMLYISCIGKKKPEVKEEFEKPALPLCSASRVEIEPGMVNDPGIIVGSGRTLEFHAMAYDDSDQPVPLDLDWYFRGVPKWADPAEVGQGHKLKKTGAMRAKFLAEGYTTGTFKIAAQIPGCVSASGLPVRGCAKININPRPDAPAVCGPTSIIYGERDVTGETVIGFLPIQLKAEAYGSKSAFKRLRVRFYLNGKHIKPDRKLIRDRKATPLLGQEAAFWAYIPFWRGAGDFEAYYELRHGNEIVCTSETAYFTTR